MGYNYHVYTCKCDNSQGTFVETFMLPQGTNLVVGYVFWGNAGCWIRVYDNGRSGNPNTRLLRYTAASAEQGTISMGLLGRSIRMELVTPASNGYYGFNVTVQNETIQNRWQENVSAPRKE